MLRVEGVTPNSIAEELMLARGDAITHICGEPLVDIIDFLHFSAGEYVTLTIQKQNGQIEEAEIEKDPEEPLGITLKNDGLNRKRSCINKCVFCFVDQLPGNMRKTLYFKDDDWRMSFIMGNYVTLTNVTEKEFLRILKRKTSPLYISVHATDEMVRKKMIGTDKNGNVLDRMRRLRDAGISFHTQVVLVGGMNDGAILDKTIDDLQNLFPYAISLAVVPVGLTSHREALFPILPIDGNVAKEALAVIESWQDKLYQKLGTRFVFAADEFYIKANRPLPSYEAYEHFGQIEDGVGMIRYTQNQFEEELKKAPSIQPKYRSYSIATGVDAYPYIREMARELGKRLDIIFHVYPIENRFFGKTITVTGLLTGRDIIDQLQDKDLGQTLLLAGNMLREEKNTFLDDVTICELCGKLKIPVEVIDPFAGNLMDVLSK